MGLTRTLPTGGTGLNLQLLDFDRGGYRGVGGGGAHPLPPEMKPSSSYWLLKFVYLTGQ